MKTYKYQIHTHTWPCSHCARMSPAELAEALKTGGYDGCVLTNHFYHGNTGIDPLLPWNEFVRQYEIDYLECKKEAEKYGKDIIFGVEEEVGGGLEVLYYGVTPEMLYAHPELQSGDPGTWYRVMHSYDALCIQAHPFRERRSIPEPKVLPFEFIDGIEVFNKGNDEKDNLKAEEFAKLHPDLIFTSGADTHSGDSVCHAGIETTVRIRNEKELVEVLKSKKYELIK